MVEFVYITQTFEWLSLLFVIVTQKDRRVEEILFDQQNPNLKSKRAYKLSKKKKRNNYR